MSICVLNRYEEHWNILLSYFDFIIAYLLERYNCLEGHILGQEKKKKHMISNEQIY